MRYALALAIVLTAMTPALPSDGSILGTVRVFYYGPGDGYLGKKHAAAWHGETPEGWRDVVDLVHYGIATSDWSIPFGTKICLEVVSFPAWSEGEFSDYIGNTVCGTVVDRMASWVEPSLGPSVDVWLALFRRLVGPDWQRIGTVTARITIVKDGSDEQEIGRTECPGSSRYSPRTSPDAQPMGEQGAD